MPLAIVVEEGAQSARGTTIITNPYLPLVTIPLRGDGRFELTVRGQTDVRNTLVPAGADCYGTPSYGFQSTPLVVSMGS